MRHDDLAPWQDTPLVQALTSDATSTELAGEDAAMTAFQSSARRRRHGVVRVLGTGVTSVALAGVVGGGVAAAAYTRSLPAPVQDVMHEVLGPIGVPAPPPRKPPNHSGETTVAAAPRPATTDARTPAPGPTQTASPSTTPSGSATPSPRIGSAAGPNPVGSAVPSVTPSASLSAGPTQTPTPTPTVTPSPGPTGPAGDPSTWSMTVTASSQVVRVHDGVRISGTLVDADGQAVPDHRVVIRIHQAGTTGWQREAVRRTDANGSVHGRLEDLTQNTVVVLGAGHDVHSSPLRIVVRPDLSVSTTPSSDGTSYVVTVTADGGQPGDVVDLLRHTPNGWEQVGAAKLDASGSASFSVPAPKRQRTYVLNLPATKVHGEAAARVVLQPLSQP